MEIGTRSAVQCPCEIWLEKPFFGLCGFGDVMQGLGKDWAFIFGRGIMENLGAALAAGAKVAIEP